MAIKKPFNLFVYGTLMNPSVFRAVLGRHLVTSPAEADGEEAFRPLRAVLTGYKKISPDRTYLYAVPDRHGRIRGYWIAALPAECLDALRHYEGRNYSRRKLHVLTKDGPKDAVVFVGNLNQLEHSFGYAFRDPLKQEILLKEKIEAVLTEAQREKLHTDGKIGRRAVGELQGTTIRDVVRRHFEAGGIGDYAIRHSIKDKPLRDFDRVVEDPAAVATAPNYLAMVVRQIVFNQFEERIHNEFRYELDRMPQHESHYERSYSSLAALQILNAGDDLLDMIVADCLTDLSFTKDHLIDFVQWAIIAADALYDANLARRQILFIRNHVGRGYVPLGAELEFSNIGQEVIRDPQGRELRDLQYDGFLYFLDFALDALTWKLGGHIDDHHEKASHRPRRGFFELALGSVSIEADLSKPITNDPWMLNQFIHEATRFFQISPHSVHISLQLRSRHRPVRNRLLPLSIMKCLFALAGDCGPDENGRLRIRRLVNSEIVTRGERTSMLFTEIRKRYDSESDDGYPAIRTANPAGRYVQQFRFLRLSPKLNYEPIIMALKGLQIRFRPGNFLTADQYESSRKHRNLFEKLLAWAEQPASLTDEEIETFLSRIHEGLMTERRGKPAHSEAYITWSLSRLRRYLKDFNAMCKAAGE